MDETARKLMRTSAVVILCGGRGTRMGSADWHKVCFPIAGTPAINRTVKMFRQLGSNKIVLVVGAMAENVISTVGSQFPQVLCVYQTAQQGTGHAAQLAVSALNHLGHEGPILVTMGDKVIQPTVIVNLANRFMRARADFAFISIARKRAGAMSGSGRIMTDKSGRVLGNIELRDIQLAGILESIAKLASRRPADKITYDKVIKLAARYITDEGKVVKLLGDVAEALRTAGQMTGSQLMNLLSNDPGYITLAGQSFTADQIERQSKTVNPSVYLGHSEFWYRFLPILTNDNAQKEYYLTDVINLSAADTERNWKLVQQPITDPTEVMGFNSPDELLLIEDTLRRQSPKTKADRRTAAGPGPGAKLPRGTCRPAGKWLDMFERWTPALRRRFAAIYGPDDDLLRNRQKLFIKTIKLFIKRFGPQRKAIIVRAPGRVNLLGRHVDHRGGAVNVMAIDRDVVFVAAARSDDVVNVCNIDSRTFPDRQFAVAELLGDIEWQDWLTYINSDHVRTVLSRTAGDWSNYVKASMLRLQQSFRSARLFGFDAAVAGDIPTAAGLSSSSAVVVASAEVAVALNGLEVTPSELVDLCGEGEWFTGTRDRVSDHTAIGMAQRGQIAHVTFFPFHVDRVYDFPENCSVMIADSGVEPRQSSGAQDTFSLKAATCEAGFMLIRDRTPQYEHLLEHLRDVNPRRLNCNVSDIYRILRCVPESMDIDALTNALSRDHRQRLGQILNSARPTTPLALRSIVLYGIAECERSLLAPMLMEQDKLADIGGLMTISHDGDRVAKFEKTPTGKWKSSRFRYDCSDAVLASFIEDLASENPQRVLDAQLYMQSGSYSCSISQVDKMVDIAQSVPGVYGAQLGGPGLGGCTMILAHPDAVASVRTALGRQYYQRSKSKPFIHVCHPVAGSGLIAV